MTGYAIAKAAKEQLDREYHDAVVELYRVSGDEKGPFGLTPDHIKRTPAWQAAWNKERQLFGKLRAFNMDFCRVYAKELKAERDARRTALATN